MNETEQLLAETKPEPHTPKTLGLYLYPSDLLLAESKPWASAIKGNQALQDLIDDMIETMKRTGALGLSAIQVGFVSRVFVARDGQKVLVFINPEVKALDCPTSFEKEGCLSFPGVFECVLRPEAVEITATDREGEKFTLTLHGLIARTVQHEIDHLNGILFTHRMSRVRQEAALKKVKISKRKLMREL